MKYILSPSILSADFKELGKELETIKKCRAEWVHIDVMDGSFVPSISFGMPVIKSIRSATDCFFDVHLMIDEPVRYIKEFKEVGADLITIHYEAASDVEGTLKEIKNAGLKAALSIKPKTDPDVLDKYIPMCDMILLMSVEPGFGGQKYIEASTARAAAIREKISRSNPDCDLQIDGGVNINNIRMILDAGVNVIVAGSAVFRDTEKNCTEFMKIIDEYNGKIS